MMMRRGLIACGWYNYLIAQVTDDVFYSDHSIVWAEAENRMWTSMAVFLKLMGYEESVTQLK